MVKDDVKLVYDKVDEIPKIVKSCHDRFNTQKTKSFEWRQTQLRQLIKLIEENKDDLHEAVFNDMKKHPVETWIMESSQVINEAVHALDHLKQWTKLEKVEKPILFLTDKAYIKHDAKGVVLVIGAWNYPLLLVLSPLVAVITGGNACVLKPSELSPHSAKIIGELIPKYMDKEAIKVVQGEIPETSALLKEKFNHICYTGSGFVGKIVMKAAAAHLTPVTLELGGKSPCFIDPELPEKDLAIAVRRIIKGRFINNGQTCISGDYIMCSKKHTPFIIKESKKAIKDMFGIQDREQKDEKEESNIIEVKQKSYTWKDVKDGKSNYSYSRIINKRRFDCLLDMLKKDCKVVVGGMYDAEDLYLSPTIVTDCSKDSKLLKEEIFGPILPIINFEKVDEAIDYVNKNDKPLALYIFSKNKNYVKQILDSTSAGGVSVNDCLTHGAITAFRFGGVGASGIGGYSGEWGFKEFTHPKGVLQRGLQLQGIEEKISYGPYTNTKIYDTAILAKEKGCFGKFLAHSSTKKLLKHIIFLSFAYYLLTLFGGKITFE